MATANDETWVADTDGRKFWGTVRQLTQCAKCGDELKAGYDVQHRISNMFKPNMHFMCDDCHETLPE